MITYLLFTLLAVLQVFDVWSTRKIIIAGGYEQNPVMAWLIKLLGLMPALVVSRAWVLAIAWFVVMPYPWLLGTLCLLWGWIAMHNWKSCEI